MLGRESLFKRPPLSETGAESAMRNTQFSCPFSKAMGFSVVGKHSRFAGILRLFRLGRPTTVFWLVVFFAVYPVYSSFWEWLRTQVFKEIDKRIKPSLTDSYAFSAIEMIITVVGVVASSFHFAPRYIFRRLLSPLSRAARSCAMAATGKCAFLAEFTPSHSSLVPALASAQPTGIARLGIPRKLNYCELCVNVADFIRALFAATAGLNITGAKRAFADNLFRAARALTVPISACLTSKPAAGVANYCQLAKLFSSNVFCFATSAARIVRRHSSTPIKLDCDRAESVNHDRLGSLYCIRYERLVQYF